MCNIKLEQPRHNTEVEREAIKPQRGFSLQADGAASARFFLPCLALHFPLGSHSLSLFTLLHIPKGESLALSSVEAGVSEGLPLGPQLLRAATDTEQHRHNPACFYSLSQREQDKMRMKVEYLDLPDA